MRFCVFPLEDSLCVLSVHHTHHFVFSTTSRMVNATVTCLPVTMATAMWVMTLACYKGANILAQALACLSCFSLHYIRILRLNESLGAPTTLIHFHAISPWVSSTDSFPYLHVNQNIN